MKSAFDFLRVPLNSLKTAGYSLVDGIREGIVRLKFVFSGGPTTEISEYKQMLHELSYPYLIKLKSVFALARLSITKIARAIRECLMRILKRTS